MVYFMWLLWILDLFIGIVISCGLGWFDVCRIIMNGFVWSVLVMVFVLWVNYRFFLGVGDLFVVLFGYSMLFWIVCLIRCGLLFGLFSGRSFMFIRMCCLFMFYIDIIWYLVLVLVLDDKICSFVIVGVFVNLIGI